VDKNFTQQWLDAWNSHDLDRIIEHYDEHVDFLSPIIQQMGFSTEGRIYNKSDLKEYLFKALQKYPDLHFELLYELNGVHSVVLFYKSVNDSFSAEDMEFGSEGKVKKTGSYGNSTSLLFRFDKRYGLCRTGSRKVSRTTKAKRNICNEKAS